METTGAFVGVQTHDSLGPKPRALRLPGEHSTKGLTTEATTF